MFGNFNFYLWAKTSYNENPKTELNDKVIFNTCEMLLQSYFEENG